MHSSLLVARLIRVAAWLLAGALALPAAQAQEANANALQAHYATLHDKLANNSFGRPLVLESTQTSGDLKGDIYTVVEYSFATVQQGLQSIDHWCDILILHLNVKRCRTNGANKTLALNVGRKFDQPIEDAYELLFGYRVAASTPDYLQVLLNAEEGPLGTNNYRIQVEAIPLDANKSLIHMSYAYGYGLAARMAMQTYLMTLGSAKVGFSVVDHKPDGKPIYIGGVLGLLERNTMRYYLAIDVYLGAYALAPGEQVEKRIRDWYASTERYSIQLHEMDQAEYLEMKRKEIRRQQQG